MKELLWKNITQLKKETPLIQNITNYVVMNNTANALLAAGASPIMAHAHSEMEDMMNICQALVINIGTLDEYWVTAMKKAAKQANKLQKPWVLDPVGAGATPYRDEILADLLRLNPTIIRGNASEIMALAKHNTTITKGVDSSADSNEAITAANFLAKNFQTTVCISGITDIILNEEKEVHLSNGNKMMAKITGMGCSATALVAAFSAIIKDTAEATVSAMALLGVAGELAAKESKGPGSLQLNIIDKLYNLSEEEFISTLKIEIKRG
ncbi:hydroxyethylthiazole kinase [Mesonia aestuariivivens]|uniref:Hydroxyethylthiazole kinase n=1 Tax=Mesonia aestuariivivens TaxID=2796128 RepID=A0ABS6W4N5_9FLAO|nr:hydroxyethylthiazole kinase [Mesonia aestuariivivens]MBW2962838.1 hydroxyethylthiazole kinase [Mesonia aestuariivivens]